jgi:hypothetical protein
MRLGIVGWFDSGSRAKCAESGTIKQNGKLIKAEQAARVWSLRKNGE